MGVEGRWGGVGPYAFRMGAYSRWALIRINTVLKKSIMKNVHLKILLAGAFYYDVKAGLQHLAGL